MVTTHTNCFFAWLSQSVSLDFFPIPEIYTEVKMSVKISFSQTQMTKSELMECRYYV